MIDELVKWKKNQEGFYEGQFSEDWFQGRGVFGGLIAATFIHAFSEEVRDKRRQIKTLTLHFSAPANAELSQLEVYVERKGTNMTFLSGRLLQKGKVVAFATSTFGLSRNSKLNFNNINMPQVKEPQELEIALNNSMAPRFSQFFEYRLALGLPLLNGDKAEIGGWLRQKEKHQPDSLLAAILLDAYPPAIINASRTFIPAASIDLTYHFFESFPLSYEDDDYYFYQAITTLAKDGYAEETAYLFGLDQKIIAKVRQNTVVFG